jgi:hypothetical protein
VAGDEQIRVDITASDDASKVIDKVADAAGRLDGKDVEIPVEADAGAALGDLAKVEGQAEALAGKDVEIAIRAQVGDLKAQLAQAESALKSLDGRKAEVEVTADTGQAEGALSGLSGSLDGVGSAADGIQGALGAVSQSLGPVGGAAAGAAIGAFALADGAADAAIQVDTLSRITGESIENTSRLTQIWESAGADANDLADVIAQVNQVMADQPELAHELGIQLRDASPQDVFIQAVEAAGALEGAQERLLIGSQLFGEEGVRQVAAVQAQYGDLSDAVDGMDPLFTDEDVQKARDYQVQMAELNRKFQELALEIGTNLMPTLEKIVPLVDALLGEEITAEDIMGGDFSAVAEMARNYAGATTEVAGALDQVAGSAASAREAEEALHDARQARVDSLFAVRDAEHDLAVATAKTGEASEALTAAMRDHSDDSPEVVGAFEAVTVAIRNERDAAFTAADAAAQLAEDHAAATDATFDATEKTSALNQSLITSARTATPAARDQIILYLAELNNIPVEEATLIVASTQGVPEATDQLDRAARDRTSHVNVVITPSMAGWSAAQLRAFNAGRTQGVGQSAGAGPTAALAPVPVGMAAATPMAATAAVTAPVLVTVNVDARGAIDPYSVGQAVEKAAERWGRVAGRWRPGAPIRSGAG